MCRALIIIAIILSFFGSILVLVGMKCTKIGGTEIVNARVTFAGGMNYLIGGTKKLSKSPKETVLEVTCCFFQGCVLWLRSPIMGTKSEQNFKTPATLLRSMCTFEFHQQMQPVKLHINLHLPGLK